MRGKVWKVSVYRQKDRKTALPFLLEIIWSNKVRVFVCLFIFVLVLSLLEGRAESRKWCRKHCVWEVVT